MVDKELLTILDADNMQQDRNAQLVGLLDLANKGETSVDFTVELLDRKSTRLNSSHYSRSRMPSSA